MTKRLAVALAAAVLATTAGADEKAAAAKGSEAPMEMKRAGVGQATSKQVEKIRAKIVALDVESRMITLQGPKGRTETFKVSPEVKRLPEFKVGDHVVAQYERGLILQYQKPDEKDAEPGASAVVARAPADQAPAGAAAAQVRATVTVTAVDQKSRIVVLEGPGGNLHKVKAGPDIQLKKLKAGDKLFAVYSESLAIALEKAPPGEGKSPAK
jgi:hypothetical protein